MQRIPVMLLVNEKEDVVGLRRSSGELDYTCFLALLKTPQMDKRPLHTLLEKHSADTAGRGKIKLEKSLTLIFQPCLRHHTAPCKTKHIPSQPQNPTLSVD
jgi:hypothetical protein